MRLAGAFLCCIAAGLPPTLLASGTSTPSAPDCSAPASTSPPNLDWSGKRVLWLGTSIPHQGRGKDGYPERFCEKMGCRVVNNAYSGSHVKWQAQRDDESCRSGRNAPKGLSATRRELLEKMREAAPDDGASSYDESCDRATRPADMGYETRINGPWATEPFDVVVIDHGHNDRVKRPEQRASGASVMGELNPFPLPILEIHLGLRTGLILGAGHGLAMHDDVTLRTPGIPGLDFWTGEVAHVTELGVEIDFDSSHLAGRYSGGGGVVRHDKAKFFDAFNLVISDIRHMAVRHGSGEVVLIIMTPPTEWTGGRNDGSIRHLNTALCQLAGKWQAHFYNLTTDLDIGPAQLRDILPDGVHPTTPAGRALIADHIAAWARRGSISPSLSGTR